MRLEMDKKQIGKQRNSSIELLRFFFIACVVIVHAYGFGVDRYPDQIFELGHSVKSFYHLSIYCICQVEVTGFMFISGFYGIKTKKERIIELILMTLFYEAIIKFIFAPNIRFEDIRNLLHAFDLRWFVSCYIVICLIAPIIENGIQTINKKTFRNIIIGFLLYVYGAHLIGLSNDHDFIFLLTVYVTARYIRLNTPTFLYRYPKRLLLFSLLIVGGIPVLFSMSGVSHYPIMRIIATNNNILLLVIASCLVIIFEKRHFYCSMINYMASSVLSIYLITSNELISTPLNKQLFNLLITPYGFLAIFAVCLICIIIDKIRIQIFKSILFLWKYYHSNR